MFELLFAILAILGIWFAVAIALASIIGLSVVEADKNEWLRYSFAPDRAL